MTITADQIDSWLRQPTETQHLEFKEAKTNFSFDKLCEYCVAIANEGGGHLILGVSDALPRKVVGSRAFQNLIQTVSDIFQAVHFRVDADDVEHPVGRVVVFSIPSRPKGTAYTLKGCYLMRSGSSLVSMSEDRLRLIFSEGTPDWLEEASIRDLDAQGVVERLDVQAYFDLMKQPYPPDRTGVLARLTERRLIVEDNGRYTITRLCGLLLAKRFEDFPDISRKAPRLVVYTGPSKLDPQSDQIVQAGYAAGFQALISLVMGLLPQNEVIRDALRRSIKLVRENTIRELIANCLIHQDFRISGAGPTIEIFPDRVVISNPGQPIVNVDRFIDGYQSRNERLADFMRNMRNMRICEERGSGIDRVILECEDDQLPPPRFENDAQRTMITVYGPQPFSEMDRVDRIRACYQHCSLKYVLNQRMTNQTLRARFGLSESKSAIASQIINLTVEAGLIKPDDNVGSSRKYARYLPVWA
ncbi:MAG TPA: MloB [Alphaproteobacteria bacterium]|nr:MloB [Alphaproteobacteria bacterium]HAJ48034.1 MloB [Alphaproteobacteria bacterium]